MSTRVPSLEARRRILDAAERLLRDRPYRELGVDGLMAEANLSRTVFYRHFDGLPAVVLTLLEDITSQLEDVLVTESLEAVLAAAVDAYARHGAFLRAVDQAAGHDVTIEAAYDALVETFTATIAGLIETAMAEGRIAPGHAYELARALNLMNIHYLLDTFGRDPGFDGQLALDTLLAVWAPLTSHAS
jgi:AcrR family transcriptional regulator